MRLNEEQRVGTLIILIATVFASVLLVCSRGWGTPAELYLFEFDWGDTSSGFRDPDDFTHIVVRTKYLIAILLPVIGYGIARLLSVVAPAFQKQSQTIGTEAKDSSSDTKLP